MNEIDLSKLNRKFYFFDELENKELIEILQNHFGEYIKIFDIEVTRDSFKLNTLWRQNERSGNICRKFDVCVESIFNNTYNRIYDLLIQKEIRSERNLKLREIGI
jgi:hypothetical protein